MDKTTGIMGHDVAATETHIAFHSATESKPSHLEPDSLLIPWALSRRQSGLRVFWQEDAPKPPVMNSRRRAALVAKRGLDIVGALIGLLVLAPLLDRKSTRLNSSHVRISYAVFCLKKKKTKRVR